MKTGPKIRNENLWNKEWLENQLKDKTIRQIAKELGFDYSGIHYAIRKLGVEVPKRTKYVLVVDKSEAVKAGLRKKYPNGRKGSLASNWKGGISARYSKSNCIDCKKDIARYRSKRCKSCARRHEYLGTDKSPFYIDGRSKLSTYIKNLEQYSLWRLNIYKRDNFTCQICKQRKDGELDADHIKAFSIILDNFLKTYKKLDAKKDQKILVKLAITYEPFWDISNGRTLCRECHRKTDNYGAKAWRNKKS